MVPVHSLAEEMIQFGMLVLLLVNTVT